MVMRRHWSFGVPLCLAVVASLATAACGEGADNSNTQEEALCGCHPGSGDGGAPGDGGNPGNGDDGGAPGHDGGGPGTGDDDDDNGPGPVPPHQSMADAEPVSFSLANAQVASLGGSVAWFPGNAGPNTGSIPGSASLGGTIPFGNGSVPVGNILGIPGGLLTSRSQATTAIDTRAASGALGANLSFEPGADPSQPITIDLLALGVPGGGVPGLLGVPAGLLDKVTLTLGAFAAETSFVDGVLQGDRYRVGQADLVLRSPAVKDASAQLYQALGGIDQQIEQIVNMNITGTIQNLTGNLVPAPQLTVTSKIRDKVFSALLAQPLTSHNKLVTIDLSTGTVTIHLDQLAAGGINNQPPNKELIDSKDYPLIATTVHDVMHDATNIALGAIEHSLDAVAIKLTWAGPVGVLGDRLDVCWEFSLDQAVKGTMPPAVNRSTGVAGMALGNTLVATLNTLTTGGNAIGKLFVPAYDLILAHAGDGVFDLAINQMKFGFTSSVVNMLQPAFQAAAQVVSVQVNHQTTATCQDGAGAAKPNAHSVSALSVGVLQASNAARLDFGRAYSEVTLPNCH